jgi:hypothetical protein
MSSQQHSTPEHAAQALRESGESEAGTSSSQKVCLGPSNNGWFVLSWQATAIGTNDWVGLYASNDAADSDYVGGNNWQWATRGSNYTTATSVRPGYQARYLIWDATTKAYKSVARTPGYPESVCSS